MISMTYNLCYKYRYLLFTSQSIVCAICTGICYSYINDIQFVVIHISMVYTLCFKNRYLLFIYQ